MGSWLVLDASWELALKPASCCTHAAIMPVRTHSGVRVNHSVNIWDLKMLSGNGNESSKSPFLRPAFSSLGNKSGIPATCSQGAQPLLISLLKVTGSFAKQRNSFRHSKVLVYRPCLERAKCPGLLRAPGMDAAISPAQGHMRGHMRADGAGTTIIAIGQYLVAQ